MQVNYVRKIGRLGTAKNFEGDDRYFEISALSNSNRKPVESFENRSDVV